MLTLPETASDFDLELDEVFSRFEGQNGGVLMADEGQHIDLTLQGEARLQTKVAIQREGGLHFAPGLQRFVHIFVEHNLKPV